MLISSWAHGGSEGANETSLRAKDADAYGHGMGLCGSQSVGMAG